MKHHLRASWKLFLLTVWTLPLVATQLIVLRLCRSHAAYTVPCLWHKGVCKIIGLKVHVKGTPEKDRQVIFMSNHLSYLDIPVIGSLLKASFVAKNDIESWPVIGFLSKVQQTAFISRSSTQAATAHGTLDTMLKEGKSIILFPEGTSSAGTEVLPFKSSLFSLCLPSSASPIPLQPFTLHLKSVNGQTNPSLEQRNRYAWYADMEFGPHIWDFLGQCEAEIDLIFHPIIIARPDDTRKTLCERTFPLVVAGLPPQEKVEKPNEEKTNEF